MAELEASHDGRWCVDYMNEAMVILYCDPVPLFYECGMDYRDAAEVGGRILGSLLGG